MIILYNNYPYLNSLFSSILYSKKLPNSIPIANLSSGVLKILIWSYSTSCLKTYRVITNKTNRADYALNPTMGSGTKSYFNNKLLSVRNAALNTTNISQALCRVHTYWSSNQYRYSNQSSTILDNSSYKPDNKIYKRSLKYFIRSVKVYTNGLEFIKSEGGGRSEYDPLKLRSTYVKNYLRVNKKRLKVNNGGADSYKYSESPIKKDSVNVYDNDFIETENVVFSKSAQRSRNTRKSLFRKKIFRGLKYARGVLKKILGVRQKGKNRFIRLVKSMNHKSFFNKLLLFEFSLISILLKSMYVSSLNDAKFLIHNNIVFVNGRPSTNPHASLSVGDRIQIPVTVSSYAWLSYRKRKLFNGYKKANRVLWQRIRKKKSKFGQRSYRYPRWLFKYSLMEDRVPSLLELDLTLLTGIILYKPYKLEEISSPIWRYININCHSLYLWKLTN